MAAPRGVCSVCLRVFTLRRDGKMVKHGALGKPLCPGVRYPHMGESTAGTHWALDQAAQRMMALKDELMIHAMRPVLRGMADVLGAHGISPPSSPVALGTERDASWQARGDELERGIASAAAELDRLGMALAEWEPGGALAPIAAPRPVIHRRWLWRERPGTQVPKCWATAVRRPTREFILTDVAEEVTCRDGCREKSHQNQQALRQTSK